MPAQTTYPGVYIVEQPSGSRTIAGVGTSVAAFVGATRMGPVGQPWRVRSLSDYTRTFGPPWDEARPLGHCISHFFTNGGTEALVVRVTAGTTATASATLTTAAADHKSVLTLTAANPGEWANAVGSAGLTATVSPSATDPGNLFDLAIQLTAPDSRTGAPVTLAQESFNGLSMAPAHPRYAATATSGSALVVASQPTDGATTTTAGSSRSASALPDQLSFDANSNVLQLSIDYGQPHSLVLFAGDTAAGPAVSKTRDQVVTEINSALAAAGLAPPTGGGAPTGPSATAALDAQQHLTITSALGGPNSAVTVTPALAGDASHVLSLGLAWGGQETTGAADLLPAPSATPYRFHGGGNGSAVGAAAVVPDTGSGGIYALNVLQFPRFNVLCLPGVTADSTGPLGQALAYCADQRAFLLVDTPSGWRTDPPALGSLPARGEYGAIYYPRLLQSEPGPTGLPTELNLPPCGAIAGVFARTDTNRGVWKAPAGIEAGIGGVSDLSVHTDDAVSGLLNPRGVNVLRTFPGSGLVVWGARTLKGDDTQSSDFKYIPVRRLTDYIASSLFLGTQFAVFEPNDAELWGQLRLAVGTFMRGLFQQGAFQQSARRAESDSFFVTCDETVNPQSEIDLGRVNVVVGFAPLKPAEFIVITITQTQMGQ